MADRAPLPRSAKDPRKPQAYEEQDFFTIPHQKLCEMVEGADHERVSEIAKTLKGAAKAIKTLGDDLKKHVDGVVWDSDAGEAFRRWGASMSNESARLSEYAKTAGETMADAASNLREATKMPKYSASDKALVDSWVKAHPYVFGGVPNPLINLVDKGLNLGGTSQKAAYDAQKRIADDHHHAAALMKKLAESYHQTGTQIFAVQRPNFPPMPGMIMPNADLQDGGEYEPLPGGPGASSGGGGGGAPGAFGGGSSGGGGMGTAGPSGPGERPGSRPDLDLSGGADAPPRPRIPLPDRPPVTPPDAGRPHIPVPPPPVPNWPGPDRRPDPSRPGGRLPDQGRRPAPRIPGPGLPGPGPVPRPDTRLPQPAPGPVPRPGGRLPNPPHDGIVGGQPGPRGGTSGPTQNPGRSNVFGTEPTQRQGQTRPPMGPVGAGGGFPGVSGPPAGRPGTGAGRHMATDPGGIVGGRPGQRPGGGGTPFTPGGTGLVRGAGEGTGTTAARNGMPAGMMPGAGLGGATPERRGGGGRRPDYLVEDEETWAQSKPVVPPVIE